MTGRTFSPNSVLPPISGTENDGCDEVLQSNSKDNLRLITQHVMDEVLSAEQKTQSLLDDLWRKMAEQVEKEKIKCKKQLDEMSSQLGAAKHELAQAKKLETSLVEQQNHMSVEMVAEKKERDKSAAELKSMKEKLSSLLTRISEADNTIERMKNEVASTKSHYQNDIEQRDKTIHDNQDKVKILNDKVQKLQEQLKAEKEASKKIQQTFEGEASKKASDGKRLAAEIAKLKSQLHNSNTSLAEAQAEIEKLRSQLKRQHEAAETNNGLLNKQHATVVKTLQKKIESLEKEIDNLNMRYQLQIESLKEQLLQASQSSKGHYLDARIQFLTHQNRKEKEKLNKEVKNAVL
ncbi:paramyosin-like isoform X2 [Dysidea avara]|uniref:paramyosin-like isoform X2 n=1 Tax=Dysidea avara TaxID=196820 RepID=UPI003322EC2B